MGKRSHLKDVQEDADMDMTPMIDVVFLLIIFFLCIEFKTLEAKLPAYLPKDKGSQATKEEPVEQLSIKIVNTKWGTEVVRKKQFRGQPLDENGRKRAFMLEGHVCYWELGPRRYDDMAELGKRLSKIAKDPSRRVPDKEKPGQTKLMAVVIEPAAGATYSDVASLVDLVQNSGFDEINFGGGLGSRQGAK